jgi:putative colanic acid biosynthesis UDP-glucose lipid carrier transferase
VDRSSRQGVIGALNGLQQFIEAATAVALYALVHFLYTGEKTIPNWEVFSVLLLVIVPPLFNLLGLYRSWRGSTLFAEYRAVLVGCALVSLVMILIGFATKSTHEYSRVVFGLWVPCWAASLMLGRTAKRLSLRWVRSQGRNQQSAVIIGASGVGVSLGHWFDENPWTGIRLLGFFDDAPPSLEDFGGHAALGAIDEALGYVREHHVDKVYLALPMREEECIKKLTQGLSDTTASVYYIPDVTCFSLLLSGQTTYLDSIPAIALWESPHLGFHLVLKQLMDYALAAGMLLALSPLFIVVAVAIKLTSPGPVLFKQWRYGINGSKIKIYKFRSMAVCYGEDGFVYNAVQKNDCRVTKVGRFIRKTSIDELPQLLNVLEGKMSIVGPRPHVVAVNEEYRKLISGYMLRHKIKPGITGLAQISGARGETDTIDKMEKRIEYDLQYIKNWSLGLDLSIILKTPLSMMGDRAY